MKPDCDSPAGRLLDRLAAALHDESQLTITVFGSDPLQLFVDCQFLSQDCDIIADQVVANAAAGLTEPDSSGGDLYFQLSDPLAFRTAQGWEQRAFREVRGGHVFVFPHPWDILVSKIGRLEPKDLEAFRLVIQRTGYPTAEEFKAHLQLAVDLFRPQFHEERGRDYTVQTRSLWKTIYGADIDPRREIIQPALERRRVQQQEGEPSLKARLGGLDS